MPGISALGTLREENCCEFKIKLWLQSKILPQHQKEGKKELQRKTINQEPLGIAKMNTGLGKKNLPTVNGL